MAAHRSDEKAALDVLASLTHADARNNSPIRERKITKPGPCSRKNKPQRCSTCGLVGHKARTCRKAAPEGDDALVGRVVSHSREGVGEIVGVQGTGKMARLKVLFVSGEEKTVMRRFVRLM